MAEPLKVCIIGYGRQGAVHAEVWASIPEAEVVAIADQDSARRELALERHGQNGRCYISDDGWAMLAEVRPDIVVVATQPTNHAALAKAAIASGAHVICEKPMALTLEDAHGMLDCALDPPGVKLAVHYQTVFTDAVRKAEELVAAGEIGELRFIDTRCKGRLACYDLMEVAGHPLHLMYHFAGDLPGSPIEGRVQRVFGHAMIGGCNVSREDGRPIGEFYPDGRECGVGAGDYLFGYYEFRSGVCGELRLITVLEPNTEFMVTELQGSRGRIRIHHTGTGALFLQRTPFDTIATTRGGWEKVELENVHDLTWFEPTRRFALDFVEALRTGRAPKVSGFVGVDVLEMSLGIYASHLAGRPVKLPLEERKHPLR